MTENILDKAVLDELAETTGTDFAGELVRTFLDEAPGMISELHASAVAGDADAFRRAAHSLKSNANTFGASALAEVSRRLELAGLPQTEAKGGGWKTSIEAAYGQAATALEDWLDA